MRPAISRDETTGSTRFQDEAEAQSFIELLGCQRDCYERQDVATPKPLPMAEVSWQQARPMAEVLKEASELAFVIEARRRGYAVASKILSGRYHDSGKRKHRRKNQSQRGN